MLSQRHYAVCRADSGLTCVLVPMQSDTPAPSCVPLPLPPPAIATLPISKVRSNAGMLVPCMRPYAYTCPSLSYPESVVCHRLQENKPVQQQQESMKTALATFEDIDARQKVAPPIILPAMMQVRKAWLAQEHCDITSGHCPLIIVTEDLTSSHIHREQLVTDLPVVPLAGLG